MAIKELAVVGNYELFQYDEDLSDHRALVDAYMKNTEIANNSNPKSFRLDKYNGQDGVLFFVLDKQLKKIIAVTSCVKESTGQVVTAKVWHRLHIEKNAMSILDSFFEVATYEWCAANGIEHLWVTFNEKSSRTALWAASRMGMNRNAKRPNLYHQMKFHKIRSSWKFHPKLILERYVWQYCFYYSPDGHFFLQREEKEMHPEIFQKIQQHLPAGD